MKELVRLMALTSVLALSTAGPAFAARGEMPTAHGVDGRELGSIVSGLAHVAPLRLAEHGSGRWNSTRVATIQPGSGALTRLVGSACAPRPDRGLACRCRMHAADGPTCPPTAAPQGPPVACMHR